MEADRLVVGFIPLLDAAALVAAVECGYATQEGLALRLVRESSWASVRDRLLVGQFQAAHLLGPMAVAAALGAGHLAVPLIAPVALGSGGQVIVLSHALVAQIGDVAASPWQAGSALARHVMAGRAGAGRPLVLAHVHPYSCHHYLLRHWLEESGVDADEQVRLVVIPPPLLADALREGQIDGFCSGEPWGSVAVSRGLGAIVATGQELWPNGPEKVVGVRAEVDATRLDALVRATVRAARWCDENPVELARMLSGPRYVGVPAAQIEEALLRRNGKGPNFHAHRHGATVPRPDHAGWYYRQMVRWHQCDGSMPGESRARESFRPELYARAVGLKALPEAECAGEPPGRGMHR